MPSSRRWAQVWRVQGDYYLVTLDREGLIDRAMGPVSPASARALLGQRAGEGSKHLADRLARVGGENVTERFS